MSSDEHRSGDVYLVLYPTRYRWELRVAKATNKKPRTTPEGSIVVKVRIRVPGAAFEPLTPEVVVTIPDALVQHPVEVEAVDPS